MIDDALIELIRDKALKIGKFILASGKEASYYLDCRQVTLDSRGANLIAEGILELLGRKRPGRGRRNGDRRGSDHGRR